MIMSVSLTLDDTQLIVNTMYDGPHSLNTRTGAVLPIATSQATALLYRDRGQKL